jgi:methane/ammonia monooxygenase subunit C
MAQTTSSRPGVQRRHPPGERPERPGRGPNDWLGGWRTLFVASALLAGSFIALRLYQQVYAWYNEAGLDAASPAFKKYWFTLFVGEVLLAGAITVGWWAWLVVSGRKLVDRPISRREEVRRIAVFWGLIGATCVVLYFMASFFPNQDGVWHQTAVRRSRPATSSCSSGRSRSASR